MAAASVGAAVHSGRSHSGVSSLSAGGTASGVASSPIGQGLRLVHFSAQLERFVWDTGCA